MYIIRSHVRVLGGFIKLLNIKDLIGLWEYSSRRSDNLIWHSNDHSCIPGSRSCSQKAGGHCKTFIWPNEVFRVPYESIY